MTKMLAVLLLGASAFAGRAQDQPREGLVRQLPTPRRDGPVAVEAALAQRHSVRVFAPRPLTLTEVSQLLWSAQGITHEGFKRAAPSAGALYPLELYLVAGAVEELEPGVYLYRARRHDLVQAASGDVRGALAAAARAQDWIATAPAVVVICAVPDRTTVKYGDRGTRYIDMEAGAAAENLALQAVALGLGTTPVGAFHEATLRRAAHVPTGERPILLLPVGSPGE